MMLTALASFAVAGLATAGSVVAARAVKRLQHARVVVERDRRRRG